MLLSTVPVQADEEAPATQPGEPKADVLTEQQWVTHHTISIDGQEIAYTATAGLLPLKDEQEPPKAYVFYIAYTRDGVSDMHERPLTFCYNGGPGSSSVWLHLGAFGPRRVALPDQPLPPRPPFQLVDNEASLLDVTDIVFIDPVSTGYSRTVKGNDPGQFHGVTEDMRSVGEFIRMYLTRNNRWTSPKFLAGESYGTTRSAVLAGYLQDERGIFLNGIVLVSCVFNFLTLSTAEGNDLGCVLLLPSCTAAAWYHKRLPPELQADFQKTLDQAEDFAINEYLPALYRGDSLSPDVRAAVLAKLSRFTGLSEDCLDRRNLRLNKEEFVDQLLRDQRRVIGHYDARYVAVDLDPSGTQGGFDPSFKYIQGAYSAAMYSYLRSGLEVENDMPYLIFSDRIGHWNWEYEGRDYVNVGPTLQRAMTTNPHLHVFVANGYYDLVTPYFATEHTFNTLGLDLSLRGHVQMGYYEGGHMMYLHKPSLLKLKRDITGFIKTALTEESD
ncbi:MAG: peptidase S10 [Phycisphaerae bacterium]|nr:peptidase S10 [Phycisphaerae bacterium]